MSRKARVPLWLILAVSFGLPGMVHAEEPSNPTAMPVDTIVQTPPAVSSLPRLRWSDAGLVSLAETAGDDALITSCSFDLAGAHRLRTQTFLSDAGADDREEAVAGAFNLSAAPEIKLGAGSLKLPLTHREYLDDQQRAHRFSALGVEWEQELLPGHRLALAAERGGHTALAEPGVDTSRTRASVTVSSELPTLSGAQLSGTVFLGGEAPKDEVYRYLGRRFYGFSLEGRFTTFRHHSPYTSFQVQRSDYDAADAAAATAPRWEDYSRLAAGWDWQIMPNWGLRAEANYSLNTSNERAYEYDRSELFFGTRFNFR
jgi:hypothetical protein